MTHSLTSARSRDDVWFTHECSTGAFGQLFAAGADADVPARARDHFTRNAPRIVSSS